MENTIEYKGYVGQFNYEPGDEAFHGIVLGLRDVIHFQGTCVAELKQALAASVDDYLAWCAEEGVAPEKPYTGKFVVRIAPDLHRMISVRARVNGVSLNQWVAEALSQQIEEHPTTPESGFWLRTIHYAVKPKSLAENRPLYRKRSKGTRTRWRSPTITDRGNDDG